MWTRHFFIVTLLLSYIPGRGNAESIIVVPPQKDWRITLVKQLEVMPDENKSWTIEKLLQSPDSLFIPNTSNKKPALLTYWAKFILKNPGTSWFIP